MRSPMLIVAAIVLVTFATADAGQIWTDGNGDGLPDPFGVIPAAPSTNVTVGLWIDAQSFTWTNFLAFVEWVPGCLTYVSASYVITGGSNFPIDDFSNPRGLGFGGSGYTQGGVDHIGNVTFHVDAPTACCVTPIIDPANPYDTFSQLGAGSDYMLFTTNPSTCYSGGGGCGDPCGACCFSDGSCQDVSEAQCASVGGTWQGPGTICGQDVCAPQTGACCSPCDASCQDLTVEDCVASGGTYQGDGTSCATAFCDIPGPSVCCFPDGSCEDIGLCECSDAGGMPEFAFNCQPGLCPGSVGACCLPTFECVDLTRAECDQSSGEWFGYIGTCETFTCETSVESQSWGRIKGLFR